jgi:hypothetical protein
MLLISPRYSINSSSLCVKPGVPGSDVAASVEFEEVVRETWWGDKCQGMTWITDIGGEVGRESHVSRGTGIRYAFSVENSVGNVPVSGGDEG